MGLGRRNDDAALINTPRFIEVLDWTAVTVTVSTVLGPPGKPLKRFRVERSTHDTQLNLGVNENITRVGD